MPMNLSTSSILTSGGATVNTLSQRNVVTPAFNADGTIVWGDTYNVLARIKTADINLIATDMPTRATALQESALMVNSDTDELTMIAPDGTITTYTNAVGEAFFGGFTVITPGAQLFGAAAPITKVALAGGAWGGSPLVGFTLANANTTLTSATGGAFPQSVGFNVTFNSDTAGISVQYVIYQNGAAVIGGSITSSTTVIAIGSPCNAAASRTIPVANGDTFELWTLVTGNAGNATLTTTSATLAVSGA